MSYLILNDYKKQIQTLNLSQVTGGDNSILEAWQRTAQEKVISYLTQKYDTDTEFTDTTVWSDSKVYQAGDRVYLDAPGFIANTSYVLGQYATFNGNLYKCVSETNGATFDPTKWLLIGQQYVIYYGGYPQARFNVNYIYATGDQVFWKGKVYTARIGSVMPDSIQYSQISNIPPRNRFPDQLDNGQPNAQWGDGVSFVIPAATNITASLWTAGDNRSQQMVQTCVDIVLYYVHQRISPNMIPELRTMNYHLALDWLKDAATGAVTPNLPVKQPNQGHRIRFGGKPKLNNSY